jgi:16S rRNA U516 pseudouridylate synthase RsuA-like enzyme
MGAGVGFPVLRLIRVQIANYKLSSLKPGNWEKIHPGMVY